MQKGSKIAEITTLECYLTEKSVKLIGSFKSRPDADIYRSCIYILRDKETTSLMNILFYLYITQRLFSFIHYPNYLYITQRLYSS